ncbi:MAG: glycosyltransferase family 9 protein [Gammaproteobacteria bacterium]|nr:glycosyltransferase family 9 protein [Gammaproteobacteria bacterium]
MPLPFQSAPESICILRLSAVGDICHTLPVARTIQSQWPSTKLTWIIGKLEASLVRDIPGIEFIVFDKSRGVKAYWDVRRALRSRRFDALLHMQMSLRSSVVNRLVNTPVRIGFDRARAKDLQWLFNNAQIPAHRNQHVMDSFFGFAEALGINERELRWDIPIPESDQQQAEALLPGKQPALVISPCSSMSYRNWHSNGYAAVCDYAVKQYAFRVVLTGGPSITELEMGQDIETQCKIPIINLIGKTNLKQLLAILKKATLVISPDSGPAHMATAAGTPVIGLYACTNPDRARPYFSGEWVIDKYHEAVRAKHGKEASELSWGLRVRDPGTMERITVEDVTRKLDEFMQKTARC